MIKNIKRLIQMSLLVLGSSLTLSAAPPLATSAAACSTNDKVMTFPTWYNGLTVGQTDPDDAKSCGVTDFKLNDFWVVVLNGVEILIQTVAYVATGFIVWGGFKYIKSEGEPAKISEAKSAILNAVIGLAIALASVAIVDFIQGGIIQS